MKKIFRVVKENSLYFIQDWKTKEYIFCTDSKDEAMTHLYELERTYELREEKTEWKEQSHN